MLKLRRRGAQDMILSYSFWTATAELFRSAAFPLACLNSCASAASLLRVSSIISPRMYKRYERAEFINREPSEKDLSYGAYYQWLDRAVKARDDYLAGKLSAEEALNIIQTP